MASRLWIVTPVYKDVESFLRLREELKSHSPHFVVVDDSAGQDEEIERLEGLDDVTVIAPPFNLGHQRAIVYGLRSLDGLGDDDLIVTMDADGEDRPEDIAILLEPLRIRSSDRHAIVLAQRTERHETLGFKLGYTLYKLGFRLLTGTVIRTGNFAAYRGALAKKILSHPHFDLCYSSTLISLNLKAIFVGCPRGRRFAGRSKMNTTRLIMHGIRMLMPLLDRIAVRALVGFSVALALGVLAGIFVVAVKVFTPLAIPGWATSTLLLILILSFIALGNFLILFTLYSQSGGISLSGIDRKANSNARQRSA